MKVAIAGAGKLGFKVASALAGGDYSITIIDIKESVLDKISQQLDVMTVKADARKVSVLQDVGISGFDYLIASTGTDEINILVASFAKKLGCRHVLARVRDPEHMNQFDFIRDATGIDLIINPDMAITAEIYKYLAEKYTLSHGIFTTDKASLIKFPAANLPKIGGHSIPEVRKLFPDFLVLALSRNGKVIIPHGDSMIEHDDLVYMLGEKKAIQEFSKKIHINKKNRGLKKVMIIGGGKTGQGIKLGARFHGLIGSALNGRCRVRGFCRGGRGFRFLLAGAGRKAHDQRKKQGNDCNGFLHGHFLPYFAVKRS